MLINEPLFSDRMGQRYHIRNVPDGKQLHYLTHILKIEIQAANVSEDGYNSLALAELENAQVICIPASVEIIANDVFDGMDCILHRASRS